MMDVRRVESPPASAAALPARRPGLADVASLPLAPSTQQALDRRAADMHGGAIWRKRKYAEARGLLGLAQIAPRVVVLELDLRTELTALVELRDTPVPCMAPGADDIHLEHRAVLVLQFPEELIAGPIAGTRPARILEPRPVFHANVSYGGPVQVLCLGASVPRGFPLREMLLTSYAALTLQSISLDAMDPAGVLNPIASGWWQANASRIPLTTTPFLGRREAGPPQAGASDREGGS